MTHAERTITFREREFKGSRLRCLLLTSQVTTEISDFFNSLVSHHALVEPEDHWSPRGFLEPAEAKLGETPAFLSEADRDTLTRWWLAEPGRANTPNWDLVSKCHIKNKRGLILVEAKAHEGEFGDDRCGATNQQNFQQIKKALGEATIGWDTLVSGVKLSADFYYQLSNRLAFAWKLAKMSTPIVLIYLGFLNAHEMESDGRILLRDHAQWRNCVLENSKETIPQDAWDRTFNVDGIPLTLLIRSAEVCINARSANDGVAI